jgi:hypothetical protein
MYFEHWANSALFDVYFCHLMKIILDYYEGEGVMARHWAPVPGTGMGAPGTGMGNGTRVPPLACKCANPVGKTWVSRPGTERWWNLCRSRSSLVLVLARYDLVPCSWGSLCRSRSSLVLVLARYDLVPCSVCSRASRYHGRKGLSRSLLVQGVGLAVLSLAWADTLEP